MVNVPQVPFYYQKLTLFECNPLLKNNNNKLHAFLAFIIVFKNKTASRRCLQRFKKFTMKVPYIPLLQHAQTGF